MDTGLVQEFARRTLELIGDVLASEELVQHTVDLFANLFGRNELDLLDVVRSRYINLADPTGEFPADLVRIAGIFGLGPEPGMSTEVFRERLRLFVQAYLQGAGTPRSILTMAAAELGVLLGGPAHRYGTEWIQPVRRLGQPSDVIRLQENPIYRVEKQPVLAKTGIRWSIDNPGVAGSDLIYPRVVIEALVDDVRGPSIIFEDVGLAWLSPTVVLDRGDKLVLQANIAGRFTAWRHSNHRVENVTNDIQLIGQVPDERALDNGIHLIGGTITQAACAYVRSEHRPHAVRVCARSRGYWGNGLMLRREKSGRTQRLLVEFDDSYAATGLPGKVPAGQWVVDVDDDLLTTMLTIFERDEFLIEAQEATLFLPTGRSHWMYLDHMAVLSENGELENLARLLLDYTRYGQAAHHNTDVYDVFRFDRDETRFGDANYTVEEERVRITYSWLEPRATAIQLEVPLWIENEEDIATRNRTYQRLSDGVLRIKPAGVAVSLIRTLPDEQIGLSEVFPEHVTVDLSVKTAIAVPAAGTVEQLEGAEIDATMALDPSFAEAARVTVSEQPSADLSKEQGLGVSHAPRATIHQSTTSGVEFRGEPAATREDVTRVFAQEATNVVMTTGADISAYPVADAQNDSRILTEQEPSVAPGVEAELLLDGGVGADASTAQFVTTEEHISVTTTKWEVIEKVAASATPGAELQLSGSAEVHSRRPDVLPIAVDSATARVLRHSLESQIAQEVAVETRGASPQPVIVDEVSVDESELELQPTAIQVVATDDDEHGT